MEEATAHSPAEGALRRSWLLHRRLSRHLNPEALERWAPRILGNLEQMRGRVRGEPHTRNLERWGHLVAERDLPGLHRALTGLDENSIQMREVSPMRGLLSQQERSEVLLDGGSAWAARENPGSTSARGDRGRAVTAARGASDLTSQSATASQSGASVA